jgi:hypothetical protein
VKDNFIGRVMLLALEFGQVELHSSSKNGRQGLDLFAPAL